MEAALPIFVTGVAGQKSADQPPTLLPAAAGHLQILLRGHHAGQGKTREFLPHRQCFRGVFPRRPLYFPAPLFEAPPLPFATLDAFPGRHRQDEGRFHIPPPPPETGEGALRLPLRLLESLSRLEQLAVRISLLPGDAYGLPQRGGISPFGKAPQLPFRLLLIPPSSFQRFFRLFQGGQDRLMTAGQFRDQGAVPFDLGDDLPHRF
ncbi:MAG: hypothetical protein BWX69_03204 [Planctomycetes bacterium ADurb.Bin069]|nr:MAG: hypothetical protein BWX69_03204 [Planctomycetes bacterium ADurb.Bin069]